MTQCTPVRTRKRISSPLEDILWTRSQDRQASLIVAEEAAKVLHAQAGQIAAGYSFLLVDDQCFFRADGAAVQAAMAVIGENDSVIVVCNAEGDQDEWTVQMRPSAAYPAAAYIKAVQARVEASRAIRH